MPITPEKKAAELVDKVVQIISRNFPEKDAEQITRFASHFYRFVAPEDLAERDNESDIYGGVLSYWNFIHQRDPQKTLVKVYNLDFERDGWQSPHTIVSVLTPDMAFIVNSVRMALMRMGVNIHLLAHPVIHVRRDDKGDLLTLLDEPTEDCLNESLIHIEIDRQTEKKRLKQIAEEIDSTMSRLRMVIDDWQAMLERLEDTRQTLGNNLPKELKAEVPEVHEFLKWLTGKNFTFLGYREYDLFNKNDEISLKAVKNSGLGILRQTSDLDEMYSSSFQELPAELRQLALQPELLLLTKTNERSIVHRPAHMDYIGIKRFDKKGNVIGERRFVGLYTSAAYHASVHDIPLIRRKVQHVIDSARYVPDSHRGKALINVLETYPREELFQISTDELLKTISGILHLQERQRVRIFVRADKYARFMSCLVFAPRDRYDTEVRRRMQSVLQKAFNGRYVEFTVLLSESPLAQVHFVVHTRPGDVPEYDVREIEQHMSAIVRTWADNLHDTLLENSGEGEGTHLFRRYEEAFSISYRADFEPRCALCDIKRMEKLLQGSSLEMALYRPLESFDNNILRFKIFHAESHLALSGVLPMLENMGVRVINERSYKIKPKDMPRLWVQEFGLLHQEEGRDLDMDQLHDVFAETFLRIWRGDAENDGFNRLVLRNQLSWRDIVIFRAYCKYLRQTNSNFSQLYMEQALSNNPEIVDTLLDLFHVRLNPMRLKKRGDMEKNVAALLEKIQVLLEKVTSLDEDRILQRFLGVIMATLRTNYFQTTENGEYKSYVSFKFDPSKVPELPEPRPMFEIFVYSPRVEGVHLRGGKVARGGLRWSDRLEDFRTEVLGLVKAQMVKNAVIVPVGSKGGFVVKHPPSEGGRDAILAEGVECYRTFICGLLDITDNLLDGKVIPPANVICHDEDDPYLVVAADKGTATFSDIANDIAKSYGFWLGDAFASGGSVGYDHKLMGITAKGAWEAVKRHFRELGLNTQQEDFTVIGIGDMAGDVFGNGMLLSPHIRLVGAFNHMHIFLDPSPDAKTSYEERERLFNLPRSTWADYNSDLISKGGGIFSRARKSIPLSAEIKALLQVTASSLTPAELIRAMLRAPVDLLWNGGIGTYVKASTEHHQEVGDRANDMLRVDGNELRCRVIGEGGNLGLTQLGRIEYSLNGGRVNTDAIDNVGGVNCSDHEVNIKILLNAIFNNGDMTQKQRDKLLADMTESVSSLVIRDSYLQTQALSIDTWLAPQLFDVHVRFMRHLEQQGKMVRELEYLPNEKAVAERRATQQGLSSPEVAVLLAYAKITLFQTLLASDFPDDPYLHSELTGYFPDPLPERFAEQISLHSLRREIIATLMTNKVVNYASSVYIYLLGEETSLSTTDICSAFVIVWEVFNLAQTWTDIEALDNHIRAQVQIDMMITARRLAERAARWILRNRKMPVRLGEEIDALKPGVSHLRDVLPRITETLESTTQSRIAEDLLQENVPAVLAQHIASMENWLAALDIVEVSKHCGIDLEQAAAVHFTLGDKLKLHWLRDCISNLPRNSRWTALSRSALRDELYRTHRELTTAVLLSSNNQLEADPMVLIQQWLDSNGQSVERSLQMLTELGTIPKPDLAMLSVGLREVRNML